MHTKPFYSLALCGALLCSTAALAQQAPSLTEEIIVTSSRVGQPIEQIGSTVSVLSARDIELQQIDTLGDALERIPGVSITRSGGVGQNTQVRMRGFTTKHVLTMIDGIKINNASESSNQYGLEHIFLNNIERTEVLRGPQSGVYGADAVAGVINVITRRGEGDPKIRGSVLYGTEDTVEVAAGADGSTGNLGYLFSASYYDTDGISLSSRPPGNVEKDGYDNLTLNGRLDWAASEDADITAWLRYIDATNEVDVNFLPAGNPQGLPAFLFQDSEGFNNNKEVFGALKGTWRTLDDSLVHDAQISYVDLDSHNETPGSVQDSSGKTLELNYNTTYFTETGTFFTLGADYKREDGRYEQPVGSVFAGIDESLWNWGLFANVNLAVSDDVYISAAVRRDDNELFGDETTYRVTGAYNLPDKIDISGVNTKLRSSYGTGAEAPSLRQLLGMSATYQGNPNLQPESTWMWDIGLEQRLESGLARWSVTYYQGRATNGIFNVFDPTAGVSSPQNEDDPVEMDGIEVDFAAVPADWIEFQLAYTYATSILLSTDTQLFGRPRHEISGSVTFRPLEPLSVTVDGYKRGKFFSDYPSTFQMPGYELFNITAAYDITPNVRLTGKVQNVFDKFYEEKLGDATYGRTAQVRINVVF